MGIKNMYLEQIQNVNDIKNIDPKNYEELAQEIRDFLIRKISVTGGHLGSNLGAVELTMALHLALKLPEDKIVWDVGHQSYTHKILTGRIFSGGSDIPPAPAKNCCPRPWKKGSLSPPRKAV